MTEEYGTYDGESSSPDRLSIADLLRSFSERPIAYHRIYAKISGSITAGLLLSQFMYWSSKKDDGWFYKTQREITAETEMSRTETESARRRLRTLGVVQEQRKGNPARMYYRVDVDRLANLIAGNLQTGMQESSNQERGNPAISTRIDYTETTAESNNDSTPIDKRRKKDVDPLHDRRVEYWVAFADALSLTKAQRSNRNGRAFGELKTAFPDAESMDELDVETFRNATVAYAARNKPEFVTVSRVIDSIQVNAEPEIDISRFVTAFVWRLERADVMARARWSPSEIERGIRDMLSMHPDMTPEALIWSLSWGWHKENRVPEPDRLKWIVRDWIADGRPERKMNQRST